MMENIMSGSVNTIDMLSDEEIDESLEMLMSDEQFEQDLINSFNTQMYVINDKEIIYLKAFFTVYELAYPYALLLILLYCIQYF